MKRAMPLLFLALTAFAQTSKQPLTNADVIEMLRASVPESTIILAIQKTPVKFDVSAEGIIALHAAGITEPVLNQMLRSAAPPKQSGSLFGVATGTFPVKDAAGKTVHFSAWIKTENVLNGYAAYGGVSTVRARVPTVPNSLLTTPWRGSSMASRTLVMALFAAQLVPRHGPSTSSSYPSARPLPTSISACS
jgi:hypothetical protein